MNKKLELSKKNNFEVFKVSGVNFNTWIKIRILNAEPDPANPFTADPDRNSAL
jgi:hypothetical protein